MYFSKDLKNIDKEITQTKSIYDDEKDVSINIKSLSDEQIFSSYNYDNKTSINSELSNYLWENAKLAPAYKNLKLKFFCSEKLDECEVKKAIQSHYRREYIELKEELKKSRFFSFACLTLGILSIVSLFILINLNVNYIITTITEIASWVFVWEAVDSFFLKGASIKQKCITLMRLYSAEIIIYTNKIENTNDNQVLIGGENEN
jgi:hypothetical protein